MQRKKFIQSSLMGSASLLASGIARAGNGPKEPNAGQPFHLNYATHDGMFKNHAGNDFIEQIKFAYEQGFRAIEDNGLMGRSPEQQQKIGDTLAKLGMGMGVFVLDKGGNDENTLAAGKPGHVEVFLKGCRGAVEASKRCGGKLATVVPGDFERNLPEGIQAANVILALRKGVEILEPHGIVMVLEPLSDNPDLFLRTADQAFAICKAVNSPSCKILFDMYHIQRNCGNLIRHIDWAYDEVAYFQIGNNPGRNEPGTGEMDYKNIFKHIYDKGFKGILGMEHGNAKPGKDGELALIKAYREADDFV
ncbi:MAG: TIM barrel protein [Bacteroidetes bacterium]|nr:TIM barrel protein [Bacteroidota bacterium]MBS1974181.1 TIM barrel protein [Bacteroidota bacterium]